MFIRKLSASLVMCMVLFASLGTVSSAHTITAGVPGNFPPHYVVEQGKPVTGLAVDILNAVAELAEITVQYKVMDDWIVAQEALRDGRIDLIPSMGVMPERHQFGEFTDPVETLPVSIIVRKGNTWIRGKDDLKGRKVGVIRINAGYTLVKDIPGVRLVLKPDRADLLFALLAGWVDAVVYPYPLFQYDAREAGVEDRITALSPPLAEIPRAIAVTPGKRALIAPLDQAIREFGASPGYKAIYAKWYGEPEPFLNWRVVALLLLGLTAIFGIVFALYRWNANRYRKFITASETKYRLLFSEMTMGMVLLDTVRGEDGKTEDYRFAEVNPNFERMFNVRASQVLGRTVREVFPDTSYGWIARAREAARKGTPVHFEHFSSRSGKHFELWAYAQSPGRFAVLFSDISERKRLEELRRDVERIMVHDLRGPLTGIVGIPQVLLMDDNLTEEQIELLGHIQIAGKRLQNQINLSLDLYRMETGTFVYAPENMDICALLVRLEQELANTAAARNIRLDIRVNGQTLRDCPGFPITADEMFVHAVLFNLSQNAVEASPEGGTVLIEMDSGGGRHRFVIHNRGTVPESVRDNFFEKYATHGKPKGTGLGTYSARLMVRAMDGAIEMKTSERDGTTLTITLPALPPVIRRKKAREQMDRA